MSSVAMFANTGHACHCAANFSWASLGLLMWAATSTALYVLKRAEHKQLAANTQKHDKITQSQTTYTAVRGAATPRFHVLAEHGQD